MKLYPYILYRYDTLSILKEIKKKKRRDGSKVDGAKLINETKLKRFLVRIKPWKITFSLSL